MYFKEPTGNVWSLAVAKVSMDLRAFVQTVRVGVVMNIPSCLAVMNGIQPPVGVVFCPARRHEPTLRVKLSEQSELQKKHHEQIRFTLPFPCISFTPN